jgi:uncharacterized protein YndB with AHSA1/START domain
MRNISSRSSIEINAPASLVWTSLTSPEIIKKYFFGTEATSTWKVGDPIKFSGSYHGIPYEDKGVILEVNPYKTFRYTYWSSMSGIEEKPENFVAITYSLREINGVTTLIVAQENMPDEKRRSTSEQTWSKVLSNLKDVIQEQMVGIN